MAVVEAHIRAGYCAKEKQRLTAALTDAMRLVMPVPEDAVTVTLRELPYKSDGQDPQTGTHLPTNPDAKTLVLSFLKAMEARELQAAQEMLGQNFQMTFPATGPMTSLEQLVAWAKDRYRFVRKTIETTDAFHDGTRSVVYVAGKLSGAWPDGTTFTGIRFIDRFEVAGGKLTRQDVWNDIAEERSRERQD